MRQSIKIRSIENRWYVVRETEHETLRGIFAHAVIAGPLDSHDRACLVAQDASFIEMLPWLP